MMITHGLGIAMVAMGMRVHFEGMTSVLARLAGLPKKLLLLIGRACQEARIQTGFPIRRVFDSGCAVIMMEACDARFTWMPQSQRHSHF